VAATQSEPCRPSAVALLTSRLVALRPAQFPATGPTALWLASIETAGPSRPPLATGPPLVCWFWARGQLLQTFFPSETAMTKRTSKKLNKADLAGTLGITVRRLDQCILRGMPFDQGEEACRQWRADNIRSKAGSGPQDPELEFWKVQLLKSRALFGELRLGVSSGKLANLDMVCREAEQRITHAKALLEQIPDRALGLLPKYVSAAQKRQFLADCQRLIADTLHQLADAAGNTDDLVAQPKGSAADGPDIEEA
jgi:hypothetical protein